MEALNLHEVSMREYLDLTEKLEASYQERARLQLMLNKAKDCLHYAKQDWLCHDTELVIDAMLAEMEKR